MSIHSYVGPANRLQCMTCRTQPEDTTELDQFRVRQGLQDPWCDMESIECNYNQDTCVTVTMQVVLTLFYIVLKISV